MGRHNERKKNQILVKINILFLVESAEKPDRPFRTGNLETLDWHWLGIPHSPNGAKKARKKTFFSWMGSLCVRLPHRFQQTWCHPSENPAVATKNSNTHLKDENIEKYCETATIQNTKILITGSPRAHFEHLGVQPGSKLHARHDGHSEIIS